MRRLSPLLGVALGVALTALPAAASPISWTIVSGSISDGALLSGSFTVNVDSDLTTPYDVTAGSAPEYVLGHLFGTNEGQEYADDVAGDTATLSNANGTLQFDAGSGILLTLNFTTPLSDAGGTDAFTGSFDTYFDAVPEGTTYADFTISGEAQAAVATTPEPEAWVLLGTGLLGLMGLAVKRRRLSARTSA